MSIVNATIIGHDRALLAVDTRTSSARPGDDSPPTESAKMVMIPSLGAGLAVAGNADLLTTIFGIIVHAGGDFDSVCQAMLSIVEEALQYLSEAGARDGFQVRQQQLIAIVGFSAQLERMRGLVAARHEHGDIAVQDFGHVVSPPVADVEIPDTPERMLAIARRQVSETNAAIPECPIGGRLLIAEISRDSMCMTAHPIS